MKYFHMASMNRSGASLIARLFDGHPDVASYPGEFVLPWNDRIYPFSDHLTGAPYRLPELNGGKPDILKILGMPEREEDLPSLRDDTLGVRKNYLAREFFSKVETNFDYPRFVRMLKDAEPGIRSLKDVYDARHKAFFGCWDDGAHSGSLKLVVSYGSGHLFISNLQSYFKEFPGCFLMTPVRSAFGYLASEKTRLARRFYGSKRFTLKKMPDFLVRNFRDYDPEAMVRSWLVAVTRIVLLQERFGADRNYFVVSYEKLLKDPEAFMRALCLKLGLDFRPELLQPTIAGLPWGGSSHQGRQQGINRALADYYPRVLTKTEIEMVERSCRPILDYVASAPETLLDLRKIDKKALYDYSFQSRYFDDEEKLALYTALAFRDRRRKLVDRPDWTSAAALLYARWSAFRGSIGALFGGEAS